MICQGTVILNLEKYLLFIPCFYNENKQERKTGWKKKGIIPYNMMANSCLPVTEARISIFVELVPSQEGDFYVSVKLSGENVPGEEFFPVFRG
jgi:hypothetical protein